MPLSSKPIKSKYTIGDLVYYNNIGSIESLTVNLVKIEVDNPNNDDSGRQINIYGFENSGLQIEESKLYSSKNSLLCSMKGSYLNEEPDKYLVPNSIDSSLNSGNFKDLSGFYFYGFDFTHIDEIVSPDTEYDFNGCVVDNADFTSCTMPANADSKAEFKAMVVSYDKDTTIWTDGEPIGI